MEPNITISLLDHLGTLMLGLFYQDKIMTTAGEGGMVLQIIKTIGLSLVFKDHGKNYDTVYNKEHPPDLDGCMKIMAQMLE